MEDSDSSPSEYAATTPVTSTKRSVGKIELMQKFSYTTFTCVKFISEKRKLNEPLITIYTTPKRKRIFGPEQVRLNMSFLQ